MWLVTIGLALAAQALAQDYLRERIPQLLGWEELKELGEKDPAPEPLVRKMEELRRTAFISNQAWYSGIRAVKPELPGLGPGLRVMFWNIERGLNLDPIKLMFTDPKRYIEKADLKSAAQGSELTEQLEELRHADLVIANELDWGVKRTGYREVPRELGEALGMNWAYAVEFLEVDPVNLGTEKFADAEAEESTKLQEMLKVDQSRFRGLHGSAIFSRYPIRSAAASPLRLQGYDWYAREKDRVSSPERGRRVLTERVFLETILREIRRGGRTLLTVTLDIPDAPQGQVTVLAAHLENRCKPAKRRQQMREILESVKDVSHPVILAGDLNTSMTDAQPTTVRREIYKRVGSAEFWATRGLKWATGVGLAYDVVSGGVNKVKNLNDPTSRHVPVIAANPEAELFDDLEKFRFADGGRWDFRGEPALARGKTGTLANSNERAEKGFIPTYSVARTFGPIGQFKLDWIFVKVNPSDSYRFAPRFPRTLRDLNESHPDRLSDHNPISVELPFQDPKR